LNFIGKILLIEDREKLLPAKINVSALVREGGKGEEKGERKEDKRKEKAKEME
jgi:hypothetical protein